MFEEMIKEILRLRGETPIEKHYGKTMALMVRRLSKLRPEQLTFQNPYYSKIKYVAHELGLPTLFLINLLRYNKLNY
jgi:hypothetical protein